MTQDDLVSTIDIMMLIIKREGATIEVAKDIRYYLDKLIELIEHDLDIIGV